MDRVYIVSLAFAPGASCTAFKVKPCKLLAKPRDPVEAKDLQTSGQQGAIFSFLLCVLFMPDFLLPQTIPSFKIP